MNTVRTAALAALVAGTCLWAAACGGSPATHTVRMEGTQFVPRELTVDAGDTVVWVNDDMFPHTATLKGRFDSGVMPVGASWRYTPTEPGEYDYVCTLHPTMTGVLRVK